MRPQGRANRSGDTLATGAGEDHHGHPWDRPDLQPALRPDLEISLATGVAFTGGAIHAASRQERGSIR